MKYCQLSLSGMAGSGKSTVGERLANRLKLEFVSVGQHCRDYAKKKFNLDINEFQDYCKSHPEIDTEIDNNFKMTYAKKKYLIIDYRLGFHFFPDSFSIFLKVKPEIAFKRISPRKEEFSGLTKKQISQKIEARNINMRKRFLSMYHVDFADESNYKIVIDTTTITPEQIVNKIIKVLKN